MPELRPHLSDWEPCPYLPVPHEPLTHLVMAPFRKGRGEDFYETALTYAGSLWLQGLPARSLLLINRALGADLTGDESILETWPLPYAAVRWILENRVDDEAHFIGNPRRHYQHLATRMVPPRKTQRSWRAWACWYLSVQVLSSEDYPADELQIRNEGVVEPAPAQISEALESHGISGERVLWERISNKTETVVVLGASDRPERYANKAILQLMDHGLQVIPVHPRLKEVAGLSVVATLDTVEAPVDTVTLYVNPKISEPMANTLVALKPRRVIFNPGTESAELSARLQQAGIATEDACTLVLLATGQY
jgi:predicted CoA-binding protein